MGERVKSQVLGLECVQGMASACCLSLRLCCVVLLSLQVITHTITMVTQGDSLLGRPAQPGAAYAFPSLAARGQVHPVYLANSSQLYPGSKRHLGPPS